MRRRSEIPSNELDLILASAQLVISKDLPALATPSPSASRERRHPAGCRQDAGAPGEAPREALLFDNGYGGFAADGREYVIRLDQQRPPMPWINVVANEGFGFLVSESGAGYTWSRNSRENRLTPWYNDPITDPHGEALYIRDEDAGVFWSPLPGPAPDSAPYEARHGFGYTRWRHSSEELEQEVWQFVPRHDPVKVTRLRLTNTSDRWRRLSLFAYYRLVLGVLPSDSGRFVVTEFDPECRALLARNRLNNEFSDGVVFVAAVTAEDTEALHFTADRGTFIGRNGSPEAPAAVCGASELDGRTGAGLDPCAALQVPVRVAPHSTVECAFLLGETADEAGARTLLERYRAAGAISAALEEVRDFWIRTLSAVEVETPSPAINLMLNGWLLYQTLSCRLWARSAFYQSGGAFGFRDQLQDSAALIYARPDLTRAQILLHAGHQFVEGDVLHWWHPPADRGIRTRFSDDLLWLPYLTAFYVQTTGDWSVLDEAAGYVTARPLQPGEDEAYLVGAAGRRDVGHLQPLLSRAGPLADARRARPAADGHRRLERRHEPRRPRRPRRERLARLLPVPHPRGFHSDLRAARRPRTGATLPRRIRYSCEPRSTMPVGTVSGTGAPTTTTAPRSARRRTTSAASTRWRRPGRCCRRWRRLSARRRRWMRSSNSWCRRRRD